MPVYEYIALDTDGHRRKGIIDAGSVVAARQKLRETDIFPVELSEASEQKREEAAVRGGAVRFFRRVGLQELALMTRQLATLIGAGLPLVPSLSALVTQIRNPLLKTTLAQIREEVNEGNSLTQSMSHFPKVFPPFYINMVRAGEASGTINLVLERLADFQEGQQAMKTKIRTALAYPLFMFFIGSGVLFFLVTFVVPNITNIFREMHQTLPGITVFLIVVSGFMKSLWWILLLILLAGIVGIFLASELKSGMSSRATGFEFDALVISLLGGVSIAGGFGSVLEMFIGAIILSVVTTAATGLLLSPDWQFTLKGIVTFLAILAQRYALDRRKG